MYKVVVPLDLTSCQPPHPDEPKEKFAFFPPNPPSYGADFKGAGGPLRFIEKKGGHLIPFVLYPASQVAYGEDPLKTRFTLLFTHGNAEDLGQMDPWMAVVAMRLSVNVVSYDYTGYGLNGTVGECSETDCYHDVRAVYEHVVSSLGVPPAKVVLWGRSLGSGPTVHLAAELCKKAKAPYTQPIAGVMLQSPLASAVRVVSNNLTWIPWGDIFQNVDKVHHISVPIFIAHGDRDQVVPYTHGQQLAAKLAHEKRDVLLWRFFTVQGAGHNDIEHRWGDELLNHMQEFIVHVASLETNAPSPPPAPNADKPSRSSERSLS